MPEEVAVSAADAMSDLLSTLRRFWWLLLTVVVLSVLAAVVATSRTPTTYTARSSLIVASNDRSPDQDAVLVQGYVAYFNDPAYQSQLLSNAHIGAGVTVEARAAAASPILLVDAISSDAKSAQSGAAGVAQEFMKSINRVRNQENTADIADLRERLNQIRVSGDNSQAANSMVTELQDRILQLQADRVNMLQQLQLNAGVTQNSPRLSKNVVFALLGGLLLGALAAITAARLRPLARLSTGTEVALATLIEIPSAGTEPEGFDQRRKRLRELAYIVRAQMLNFSVLAVTEPEGGSGAAVIALSLAKDWADQGVPTLLIRANVDSKVPFASMESSHTSEKAGFEDLFGTAGSALTPWVSAGPVEGMWVLEPPARSRNGASLEFPGDSMYELLARTRSLQGLVILEAPPILGYPDAPVLCGAAGRTILVIDPEGTRASDTAHAVSILEQADCGLLGAVLLHSAGSEPVETLARARGTSGRAGSTSEGSDAPEGAWARPRLLSAGLGSGRLARSRAHRSGSAGTDEQ